MKAEDEDVLLNIFSVRRPLSLKLRILFPYLTTLLPTNLKGR